jgi:hypothetical protein
MTAKIERRFLKVVLIIAIILCVGLTFSLTIENMLPNNWYLLGLMYGATTLIGYAIYKLGVYQHEI